jgi:endonuclease III
MKTRAVARRIFDALERHYPDADTELAFRTPFELLVATILSAQSTDQRVNMVTPDLFQRYPDARALAGATPEELEPIILSTGFFRQKSRSIVGMAKALVEHHGGEVPADMDALVKLPGVGRKTANVVLGHALGVPGFPVDRHVLRVSNRLGLVASEEPEQVEEALCAYLPPERWTKGSDLLILHGRRICRPTPLCARCNARKDCDFFRSGGILVKATGARGGRAKGHPSAAAALGTPPKARPLKSLLKNHPRARASAFAKAPADRRSLGGGRSARAAKKSK